MLDQATLNFACCCHYHYFSVITISLIEQLYKLICNYKKKPIPWQYEKNK